MPLSMSTLGNRVQVRLGGMRIKPRVSPFLDSWIYVLPRRDQLDGCQGTRDGREVRQVYDVVVRLVKR